MGKYIISYGKDKAHCRTDDYSLHVTEDSRLKNLRYNSITCFCSGSSIYDGGKEVSCGFIGEALRSVARLAGRGVESCSTSLGVFMIRLKKK